MRFTMTLSFHGLESEEMLAWRLRVANLAYSGHTVKCRNERTA
jgi:hypothetical protein